MKKLLLSVLSFCSIYSYAQFAALDSTYGTNGITQSQFELQIAEGRDIKVLSDGKILIAGFDYGTDGSSQLTSYFAITRQNSNGTVDVAFNSIGYHLIEFPNSTFSYGKSIAIRPNGKIVFAGAVYNGSNYDAALTQLNADGTIDTPWGNNGYRISSYSSSHEELHAVALDSSGRIYVTGYTTDINNNFKKRMVVARYTTNGQLDSSFGSNGLSIIDASTTLDNSEAFDIKLLNNGEIVIGGYAKNNNTYNEVTLVRLDSLGNELGIHTPANYAGQINKLAIQADGKIVATGNMGTFLTVLRFNSNGTLDNTFGSSGYAWVDQIFTDRGANNILIDANNKIVIAGRVKVTPQIPYNSVLARFNTNGTVDSTFTSTGYLVTEIGSFYNDAIGMAMQSDGKILVTGRDEYNPNSGEARFGNARFNVPNPVVPPPPTSVKENSLTKTVIYPNPANNRLNIDLANEAEIEIYAITGKLMDKFSAKQNHIVDISAYPNGMYFVKTHNETIKFVKQ